MSTVKRVALAGATGNLGSEVLKALIDSNYEVTVLTRQTPKKAFPSYVKVAVVDYESLDSLKAALEGTEVVVATLGSLQIGLQKLLIDASIAAKVKRFIPSEFGSDLHAPKTRQLPVFKTKIEIEDYLEEKAKTGEISYTIIHNGAFFDWGIRNPFLANLKEHKIDIIDGGDIAYSASNLSTIAKAIVGTLKNLEATKNGTFYIHDTAITPNKLLSIIQKYTPGVQWTKVEKSSEALEKHSNEQLQAGNFGDPDLWSGYVRRAMFGPNDQYGGNFSKHLNNDIFGIKELTDAEIDSLVKGIIEEQSKAPAAL